MVGGESVELSKKKKKVIYAFNLLKGNVDFSQLDDITEYLQVVDIEVFIDGLLTLKQHSDEHNNHSN